MTRIDFHFNAPDKVHYACRLTRKVRAAGSKLVFYSSDAALLAHLDRALWTFAPLEFLPHCHASDPQAIETPILLTADNSADPALPHHDVLVNLDTDWPAFFSRFERLIEIVTPDESDRLAGRTRWKFYKDRGYALTHHDIAGPR